MESLENKARIHVAKNVVFGLWSPQCGHPNNQGLIGSRMKSRGGGTQK